LDGSKRSVILQIVDEFDDLVIVVIANVPFGKSSRQVTDAVNLVPIPLGGLGDQATDSGGRSAANDRALESAESSLDCLAILLEPIFHAEVAASGHDHDRTVIERMLLAPGRRQRAQQFAR